VSAEAALKLVGARAQQAESPTRPRPWPEFAEYDCFACHHDLRADSWRQKRGYHGRVPGLLPWNDWYYAMPLALAQTTPLAAPDLLEALDRLDKEMRRPFPDPKKVVAQAQASARVLKEWLGKIDDGSRLRFPPREWLPQAIEKGLAQFSEREKRPDGKPGPEVITNWDAADQLAYALWVDAATRSRLSDPQVSGALTALFDQLAFKASKRSLFDSPERFDRAAFIKELQKVRKLLER
jgi:hypothetical protein